MKFATKTQVKRAFAAEHAFTLAEVLAALVFMAILIPVALEGLSIASRAGEVAARKSEAVILAESLLNENAIMTNGNQSMQSGVTRQGIHDFHWSLHNEPWVQDKSQNSVRLLWVEVVFNTKGKDYSLRLDTLVGTGALPGQASGLP
jgi:type II secretory pathway pseudopilin PulG